MEKYYGILSEGKNWNKVNCSRIKLDFEQDSDPKLYEYILLKDIIKNKNYNSKKSFFTRKNISNEKEFFDSIIYVEKNGYYLVDIITGIKFPYLASENNEEILFNLGSVVSEKHIANVLRSLDADDIQRYKNAIIEFKKAIDYANLEIQQEKEADRDYILQFKKNNHL